MSIHVLADHALITAVPFLVPAAVILGFLAFIVIRDRRQGDDPDEQFGDDDWTDSRADTPADDWT